MNYINLQTPSDDLNPYDLHLLEINLANILDKILEYKMFGVGCDVQELYESKRFYENKIQKIKKQFLQ